MASLPICNSSSPVKQHVIKILNFRNVLHYVDNASLTASKEAMQDRTGMREITQ